MELDLGRTVQKAVGFCTTYIMLQYDTLLVSRVKSLYTAG